MDKSTIKRLAIQCGIENEFFQGGELEQFAQAVIADFVGRQKPVVEMRWINGKLLAKFNQYVEAGTPLFTLETNQEEI